MPERAWCFYRNLVHTCYREIRHVGPPRDSLARLEVPDFDRFTPNAANCRRWRDKLEGTELFAKIEQATSIDAVLRPYREVTGLEPNDLVELFRRPGWASRYGAEKWAVITEHLIELQGALARGDWAGADVVCDNVSNLHHNSGRLVPDHDTWKRERYQQAKWPRLCD